MRSSHNTSFSPAHVLLLSALEPQPNPVALGSPATDMDTVLRSLYSNSYGKPQPVQFFGISKYIFSPIRRGA